MKNIRRKDGEEVFVYRALFPVSVWRMLQEVATAEGRTAIMQLVIWINEGYVSWRARRIREGVRRVRDGE